MNPKTEQVIALKNDGWSLRNIANEVGISVFTVRSILAKQAQPTPDIVDTAVDAYPDESVPKAEVKNLLSGLLAEHSNNQLRAAKKKYVDQFNRLIDEW
jgi:lambda repressor-like predicted transcriptional regulator